jgi:hypothetical protein
LGNKYILREFNAWGLLVKFRLVFETETENGKKVQLKFNVPPSKHQGLVNFLKIAVNQGKDVQFTVEKVTPEKKDTSKVAGKFKLVDQTPTPAVDPKK